MANATKRLCMIKNKKVSVGFSPGICGLTIFRYSFLCKSSNPILFCTIKSNNPEKEYISFTASPRGVHDTQR